MHYSFWLDLGPTLNSGDGEFVENAEVRWIKRAFELALQPDMGENKIADQLHSEGFRSSHPQTKGKKLDGRTSPNGLNRSVSSRRSNSSSQPTGSKAANAYQ